MVFLIFFFFFGPIHDFLKSLPLPAFLISYTFILSLTIITFILLIVRLKKIAPPVKANRFFLYLTILFCILESGITLFYLVTDKIKKNDPAGNNPVLDPKLSIKDIKQKPDIFFIVIDEYTSSKALKKYFNFDNSLMDSSLSEAGFFISTNSQSNYNATLFSIGSSLNMQYFNSDIEETPYNTFRWLQGIYTYNKSFLPILLEKNGYEIINLSLFDLKNHPIQVEALFKEFSNETMYHSTLFGRIKRDIYWNIAIRLPGYSKSSPPDIKFINRNYSNYCNFLRELKKETNKPRFVISHVLIPHKPAYVDRKGQPRRVTTEDLTDKKHDELYLEQLIYVNTWIDSIAKTAASPERSRPLVLIIEGDHGNRFAKWGTAIREKQFMNLNAYYFSDKDYSMLYDSISPVNSFRVMLNKYFNSGLPLLKDSTIRLSD